MFIGAGTAINAFAVAIGSGLGILVGTKFPSRTRELIIQVMGLCTGVIGASSVVSGLSSALTAEVGSIAPMLIVIVSLVAGAIIGAAIRIEEGLDHVAERLRVKLAAKAPASTFVEGAVSSTLVFCVGPLAILGALSDGLGLGPQQLLVKSVMDGVAAVVFASSFGIGVLVSVIPIALYQGALTLVGAIAGNFLSQGQIDALTATGGIILIGLGLRLTGIKKVPIGDLLPALVLAPALTALVGALI